MIHTIIITMRHTSMAMPAGLQVSDHEQRQRVRGRPFVEIQRVCGVVSEAPKEETNVHTEQAQLQQRNTTSGLSGNKQKHTANTAGRMTLRVKASILLCCTLVMMTNSSTICDAVSRTEMHQQMST